MRRDFDDDIEIVRDTAASGHGVEAHAIQSLSVIAAILGAAGNNPS